MPISCHFWDCKAVLVTSLTHVSGTIASVQTFTYFTFTFFLHILVSRLIDWWTDGRTDWLIYWLTAIRWDDAGYLAWLIDWLVDLFVRPSIHPSIHSFTQLTHWLIGWLVDSWIHGFIDSSCQLRCCLVFSLMLMAVYNVSINHKGFKYLRSKSNLVTQLAWLVQSMYFRYLVV